MRPKLGVISPAVMGALMLGACGVSRSEDPGLTIAEVEEEGAALYAQHCLICHQAGGTGVPFLQPPLPGAPSLSGDPELTIAVLLNGSADPYFESRPEYGNPMAGYGYLSDRELAILASYSRRVFGQQDDLVSPRQVAAMRPPSE